MHTLVALSHAHTTGRRPARRRLGAAVRHPLPDERAGVPRARGTRAVPRRARSTTPARSYFRVINPCLDGYVAVLVAAGPIGGPMMRYLMDWADREGVADPVVKDRDYSTVNFFDEPEEFFAGVRGTIEALFARHTKAELYQAALDHLLLARAGQHRGRHPRRRAAGGRASTSSRRTRASAARSRGRGRGPSCRRTPLATSRRAPYVGEHTTEVLARPPRRPPPRRRRPAAGGDAPFDGLHVLDLSWVGVGPDDRGLPRVLRRDGGQDRVVQAARRPAPQPAVP